MVTAGGAAASAEHHRAMPVRQDPVFEEQMKQAREVMKARRAVLHELAK